MSSILLNPILFLLVALPAFYAGLFVHELGHALLARAVGFQVNSFGVGTARPWCVIAPWGVRVYFGIVRPFQGLTFIFPTQLYPSRICLAAFAAGGILGNVLLALLALLLWSRLDRGSGVWLTVAVVNGWLAGANLIPFRFRIGNTSLRTDGALILQAFSLGTFVTSAPMVIQALDGFRGLWIAIGDTMSLRVNLLGAAASWADLGELERGEALLQEAQAIPGGVPPWLRDYRALVQGGLASAAGRSIEARDELSAALDGYRSAGNEAAQVLLAADLAIVAIRAGEAGGAAAELDSWMAHPLVSGRPEFFISLLTARLAAVATTSDRTALERLLTEYEAARRRLPSATRDLRVFRAVARCHARREDWAAAEPAYRRAIAATAELAAEWHDRAQRARFLKGQSPLLEEVRHCLHALGKPDEAELVEGELALVPAPGISPDLDRRLRRWGIRGILFNVAVTGAAMGVVMRPVENPVTPLVTFAVLMILCSIPGVLYLAFDQTAGRLLPRLRQNSGKMMLVWACMPWLTGLSLLLISLFQTTGSVPGKGR